MSATRLSALAGCTLLAAMVLAMAPAEAQTYQMDLTPTPPPPEEAIANSDFEQGFALAGGGYIANGWAEWEFNAGAITGYDEALVVHGGAHSQRLRLWRTDGGSGGAYQQVPVAPGTSYTVSAQTRAYDTLSYCSLGIDPAGGTNPRAGVIWSSGNNSTSWVQQTWSGPATSTSITIYLRVTAADSAKRNCYFDDVTLVFGPPPSPVANSDFEQGFALAGGGHIANGWAEWEFNADAITGYDEAVTVYGGAHSQRLRVWTSDGGSGGTYQQVPVAPGTSYTVSVQTRAFDTLSYCSLGVDPAGGTNPRAGVIWSSSSNTTSWVQQAWTGSPTSNTITVYLRAAAVDGAKRNCYFDDVTLVSGAEPAPTSTPTAIMAPTDTPTAEPPTVTATQPPPATVTATEPPPATATEPPAGYSHRYWVRPDWLSPYWGYRPRPVAPAPAVNRTGEINNRTYFRRAELTEEWQWFWVDLLSLSEYQRVYADLTSEERAFIVRAFGSLTHDHLAFTNNAGSATRNCYPCGQTDRGEDMRIDPLICGGNTVLGSEPILNERGEWMVRLYSFHANEHPPVATLEMLDDPRVLWATIITNRRLPDGSYMLYWFPQLRDGTSVPYPYLTVEPYYYPLEELEEYPLTDPRRPLYNLP